MVPVSVRTPAEHGHYDNRVSALFAELPVGIADLYNASVVDWGMIMAAGLLVLTPVLGVFFVIQKYMVAGLGAGALKG